MHRFAGAFLDQNELCAETLTTDQIADYARHHSGGLIVLIRHLDNGLVVKMHDSWGDDDTIVVHQYDPDADDPEFSETEIVWDFTDATAAFNKFQEL